MRAIKLKAIPSVLGLAIELAHKNISVDVNANSPLGPAIIKDYILPYCSDDSAAPKIMSHNGEIDNAALTECINTTNWIRSRPMADNTEVVIAQVTQATRAGISYFKGDVAVDINTAYTKCTEEFATINLPVLINEFDICELEVPKPILEYYELIGLGLYKDLPVRGSEPATCRVNISLTPENMTLGSEGLDKSIREFDAYYPATDEIRSMFFGNVFSVSRIKSLIAGKSPYEILTQLLPVYLAVHKVIRSGDMSNVKSNGDIKEIEAILVSIRKFCGVRMNMALNNVNRMEKVNTLVLGEDRVHKKIYVLRSTYTKFLAEGGTAEAMLGRLLNGDNAKSLEAVQRNILDYTAKWNGFTASSNHSRNAKLLKIEKDVIRNTYLEMIRDRFGMISQDTSGRHIGAKHALDAKIAEIKPGWHSNMRDTFIDITCDVFHVGSYAKTFLRDVECIAKSNPKLDTNQVMMVATINYVGVYLKHQLLIRR